MPHAPATVPTRLTRSDAVRFLQRASFGARPGDVEEVLDRGIDGWITHQMQMPAQRSHVDRVVDDGMSPHQSVWGTMFTAPDQLRRRVAYALSQIFVVSDLDDQRYLTGYIDLLERAAFGTYRNLLETVSRSHAMGWYLTFIHNKREDGSGRVPDENYAREIMQLFSIGLWELNSDGTQKRSGGNPIATYDIEDVQGLARVFTGWSKNPMMTRARYTSPMIMRAYDHEPGEKRFLGTRIPAGTSGDESLEIALDTLAAHPNVGPFIGRQLIQRLVTSNPTVGYVRRISQVWANDGRGVRGNLAAVVRAILTDDEAWRPAQPPSFGKLREPVLRFTIVGRALGLTAVDDDWRFNRLENPATELGQQPYAAPSVFNFYRPGYVPPRTELAAAGLVAPEFQLANESSTIGWINFLAKALRKPVLLDFDIDDLLALANRPGALVDELAARLCPDGLGSAVRSIAVRRVDQITLGKKSLQDLERVLGATVLIAASTDFLYER